MANTLKFGNGEWYGKKDTILAYNDENSNYKPLPFNFSRASKATVINKDGLIEEVGSGQPRVDYKDDSKGALLLEPSRTNLITQSESFPNTYWTKSGASIQGNPSTAGSELVTNGDFDTDSDWIKDSGWTISGGLLNCNNSTSNNTRQLISDYSTSKLYLVTYTISNYSSGGVRFDLGYNNGVTRNANGTYTEQLSFLDGGAFNGYLRIFSDGASQLSIDNLSVKEVQGFTSPDGTNNAYEVLTTASGTSAYDVSVYEAISGQPTSAKTNSFFVKPNGQRWLYLVPPNGGSNVVFFDLQNGVIGTEKGASKGKIETYPNGWYRLSLTEDTNINYCYFGVGFCDGDDSFTYTQSSNSIFLYGAQYELGSYATSYISTSGSAVTRLADVCNNGGNDQVINSTEGVLYANILKTNNSDYITLSISADANNFLNMGFNPSNKFFFRITANNSVVFNNESISSTNNRYYKIAFKYKSGDSAIWIDGIEVFQSTQSFSFTSALSDLSFKFRKSDSLFPFYGNVKDVKVYNTALSDSELQALTQV